MTPQTQSSSLASLEAMPFLDNGEVSPTLDGKVGIYAIFDRDAVLQYVGYSRDVATSLRQHLVRCPEACHSIKVQTVDRPSRTLLETIRNDWIAENGATPPGNSEAEAIWTQPIDAKLAQIKYLKKVARRVEAQIVEGLKARGVTMDLRFNPKLKESGLLDLK